MERLINELDQKQNDYDKDLQLIKDKIYKDNISIVNIRELINSKKQSLNDLTSELNSVLDEINSLESYSLDKELNNIIEDYYVHQQKKLELEHTLETLNKEKLELNSNLNVLEQSIKKMNSEYNNMVSEINSLEVDITKLNMNLDILLNRLSDDYQLGYERAKNEYVLEMEESAAREKVNTLRKKIKSLGEINLGSIEEFERVSTRVNFLNKQKEDLLNSENDLLSIIDDMDNVMKDKFVDTFNKINTEFSSVFKTLFKGGKAYLELTEPNNILETGINIIAIPPGKTLKPLSLLSGGERTMTAISLLFSIMNLERVPFVILDEVESALDENNATIFGQYLDNYKGKTQLLVITHKKKTMELLDTLYGITMQESGVSN